MKKLLVFFFVFGSLLFMAGCADGKTMALTSADNGKTFNAVVGDKITVTLDGNPTTGFTWETEQLNIAQLQQIGEPEYTAASSLLGSAGTYVFTFTVVGPGEASLKLIYHRTWEEGVPPEQTFEVTVLVK
jgi:inhibitor of cysteine peptidase